MLQREPCLIQTILEAASLDAVLYRGIYAWARVTDVIQNTRRVKYGLQPAAQAPFDCLAPLQHTGLRGGEASVAQK